MPPPPSLPSPGADLLLLLFLQRSDVLQYRPELVCGKLARARLIHVDDLVGIGLSDMLEVGADKDQAAGAALAFGGGDAELGAPAPAKNCGPRSAP